MEDTEFRWIGTRPTNTTVKSVCDKKRPSDRMFGEQKIRETVKRKKMERITRKKRKRINSRIRRS
jgi:hypothetical protein